MSAFIQCQTVQTATTSFSKSITTTAGNTVIAFLCYTGQNKANVGTITQTSGDTATQSTAELSDNGQPAYIGSFIARNVAGGATTFAFSWAANAEGVMFLVEMVPSATVPLDVFTTEALSAATTHAVGPTAAIADATELAIAVWNANQSSSNTPSVDNAFTIPTNGNVMGAGVTDCRACLAYKDITSAPTVTLTTNVSVTAIGLLATFRLPAATDTLWAASCM